MIQFIGDKVIQKINNQTKEWQIDELLEAYDPLPGEPLAERNALFREIVPHALERYEELSPAARLCYDFWKNLRPERIEEKRYEYTTKVTDTYRWQLDVNPDGLFFTDLSGKYGQAGRTYPQLFSDFWFYGPLLPLPSLDDRKWVVAQLRNAFLQIGGAAYTGHFPLFDYPDVSRQNPPQWETGDYRASDFVLLRPYGVEYGRQNFRDGLVYLNFVSFEQILTRHDLVNSILTTDVLDGIHSYLKRQPEAPAAVPRLDPEVGQQDRKARSRELYLSALGMIHNIYRDGHGDEYDATAADEARWRGELIEQGHERLWSETNEVVLKLQVQTLLHHGAEGVEDLLLRRAATASPRARQAIAYALWEGCRSEKSVDVLLTLLPEPDTYWRDYVFSTFGKMRDSRRVRQWVVLKLQATDAFLFQKAVDIVRLWGLTGEQRLADSRLFENLTLTEKSAGSPAFQKALDRIIHLIQTE